MERKKQKILMIIIVIVLFVIAIFLFLFFRNPFGFFTKKGETEEADISEIVLNIFDKEQLESIVENNNLQSKQVGDSIEISGVKKNGEDLYYTFEFNQDGGLVDATQFQVIDEAKTANKYSAKKLKENAIKYIQNFSERFGISLFEYYQIFTDNEILDSQSEESFQKIIDGNAQLELSVRDEFGGFWILKIERTYGEDLMLWIDHYLNNEDYYDLPANIDLQAVEKND